MGEGSTRVGDGVWIHKGGRFEELAAEIGLSHTTGALLDLQLDRTGGESRDDEEADLTFGWNALISTFPSSVGRRIGWAWFRIAIPNDKKFILSRSLALYAELRSRRATSAWQIVLTQIVPGPPERSLQCDPGYDLRPLRGTSFVAWVTPSDQESSRPTYPVVSIVERSPPKKP